MKVKIGDAVKWKGAFGMDAPRTVHVVEMEVTDTPRSKYGKQVTEVDVELIKKNRVLFTLDNGTWAYSEQIEPYPENMKQTPPKGETKSIDFTFQESSAIKAVDQLISHGIRAKYQRRSCTIEGEPFVEHTYVILVDYVHIDELNCAKRILCLP